MSRRATIVMWIVPVLLGALYLFPLWQIHLQAAQYPNGLGIHIWINQITGAKPHDLQNINGLNHYIGMKAIEPDAIPELKYMKWINAVLMGLAVLVALLRKKWALAVWVVLAIILSGLGMYDFYKWEYDYGHNLDPNAAIKIPGMTYQPPMFGTKQLLNFTTTAWPGIGGICAMLAVGLASLALLGEFFGRRRKKRTRTASAGTTVAALLLATLTLSSCSQGPKPIDYGMDACDYCIMSIADDRYGAEIVTSKGRAYKYDSIECMLSALAEGKNVTEATAGAFYTTDYATRRILVDATTATFLHAESLPSPMGMSLTGFGNHDDAVSVQDAHPGELMTWDELKKFVAGKRKG